MAASPEHPSNEIIPSKPDDVRSIAVGLYPEFRPKTPWIRLKGMWLSDAGFIPGSRVRVKVTYGCLMITQEPAKAVEPFTERRRKKSGRS